VHAPALAAALAALDRLAPEERLEAAVARLRGAPGGPLAAFTPGREGEGAAAGGRVDGALLDALCARALAGARGAVFTPAPVARLLAAHGLAAAAALRGGPARPDALAALLLGERRADLARALEGLAVLDPACGAGALLVQAALLARRQGAALALHGRDLAPLAVRAAAARLALLGAAADVAQGDAVASPWPGADLVLANPPFLRHEALAPAEKLAAARASGLSRQADLSAHLAALAVRRAPAAALVWPRALDVSRSAEPLLADARARGGFVLRLRSRAAGSFAASVDTLLAVWVLGAADAGDAEATVPLDALEPADLVLLARGGSSPRLRRVPAAGASAAGAGPGAVRLGDACEVRFGTKSGCNAFFHLRPDGTGRFRSALAGEVRLGPGDVTPLLASLKEARAPALAAPAGVLFRPAGAAGPSPSARRYVARGEAAGVHLRATCASRSPWWLLQPGRGPAPVLYPAKVSARAFAFLNEPGLWEDKKWHALFPRALPAWQVAALLCATPLRLAVDEAARQLTGAQAIADVDCRVLAGAPFPAARAIAGAARALEEAFAALARDPVTTDLRAMLDRPAQRELDLVAGRLLGLGAAEVEARRAALVERVAARLAHAEAVRRAVRDAAG
jgi:hypothetical protein